MKIVAVHFEKLQANPASAEFVVRVELDGPAAGWEVTGQLVGPRCEGVSTVEVAYPLRVTGVSDSAVSLRCVIPEPNLWTPDAPFTYAWSIAVGNGGEPSDRRAGAIALRAAG